MLGGGDHGEPHDWQRASNLSHRLARGQLRWETLADPISVSALQTRFCIWRRYRLVYSKIGHFYGTRDIPISVPLSMMRHGARFAFVEIRKIKVLWTIEIDTPSLVISAFKVPGSAKGEVRARVEMSFESNSTLEIAALPLLGHWPKISTQSSPTVQGL